MFAAGFCVGIAIGWLTAQWPTYWACKATRWLRECWVRLTGPDGRGTAPRTLWRCADTTWGDELADALPLLGDACGRPVVRRQHRTKRIRDLARRLQVCNNCADWGRRGWPMLHRLHAAVVHVYYSIYRKAPTLAMPA